MWVDDRIFEFDGYDYYGDTVGIDGEADPAPLPAHSWSVVDRQVIWAVGNRAGCPDSSLDAQCGAVVRSIDGGRTWTEVPAPHLYDVGGNGFTVTASSAEVAMVQGSGVSYTTTDGGQSWRELPQLGLRSVVLDPASGRAWVEQVGCDPCHAPILVSSSLAGPYEPSSGTSRLQLVRSGDASAAARALLAPISTDEVMVLDLDLSYSVGTVPVAAWRVAGDSWTALAPPCGQEVRPSQLAGSAERIVASCGDPVSSTTTLVRWDRGSDSWRPLGDPIPGFSQQLTVGTDGSVAVSLVGRVAVIDPDKQLSSYAIPDGISFGSALWMSDDEIILGGEALWRSDDAGQTWERLGVPAAQPLR